MIKTLSIHVMFWVFTSFVFAVSEWGYQQTLTDALKLELLLLPGRLLVAYVNWFYLMRQFLYQRRMVTYGVAFFVLLLAVSILHRYFTLYIGYPLFFPEWMEGQVIQVYNLQRIVQNMIIIFIPVGILTTIKMIQDWNTERRRFDNLQKENVENELKFLKAQTNPHFLFNALNSIYGLALDGSKKVPKLILLLSNILSYSLYESKKKTVKLAHEVELIRSIIKLENTRFEDQCQVSLEVEGDMKNVDIYPLILIPFVENAFKHGLRKDPDGGWIKMSLYVSKEQMSFFISNSLPQEESRDEQISGIGLSNLSRRLELLYGEDHELDILCDEHVFSVELNIYKTEL